MKKIFLIMLVFFNTLLFSAQTHFTIALDRNYAPFSYIDSEGNAQGFYIDLWKTWAKNNNYTLSFLASNWEESVKNVQNKNADFHSSVYENYDGVYSSKFIHEEKLSLFVSSVSKITNIESLANEKIGVIDASFAQILKSAFGKENIGIYENYEKLFQAIEEKEIVAFFDTKLAVEAELVKLQRQHLFSSINFETEVKIFARIISASTSLIKLFEEGWGKVTLDEKIAIEKRWIRSKEDWYYHKENKLGENTLVFNKDEKLWLENNSFIKLAIMNYWESDTNGHNIHTDLIKLLNKYGHINIIPIRYDTWEDGFNAAIDGEFVNGIMNLSWSKEREKEYFNYSKPYDAKPNLLIVREGNETIKNLKDLENKSVYIKENSITKTILSETSSKINLIEKKNIAELLKAISSNDEVDAIFTYKISSELLKKYNLKIVKKVYGKYATQHIGINKKYKELHSIINKVLKIIPKSELIDIQQRKYEKKKQSKIELNEKELTWIKNNPIVKVGGEMDWAPFDFVNPTGTYSGLAKDYLDLISSLTGLEFQVQTDKTWDELLTSLKKSEIDLLPAIYYSNDRAKDLSFSTPYLSIADYYITKASFPKIYSIETLYGQKVVSIKGFDVTAWLKENHPKIEVLEVDSIVDALRAVKAGEASAFINDNPSSTYAIEKNFISGLKINSVVKNRIPISLHMATYKNNSILTDIIGKAIKNIDNEQKREISNKWMSIVTQSSKTLNLNEQEIAWLSTKPKLKFAVDPNWLPIEAINKDTSRYEGMMADLLNEVSTLSGIEFELVTTKSWDESINLIKDNKVDMLPAISITPKRKEYLNFSNEALILSDAVIMKNDTSFISSLDGLKGLRIGVSKGTSLYRMLKEEYPYLILVPIKGIEKGLDNLVEDKIDAFVGNLEVASHLIFQKSLFNLKVVYKLDKTRNLHIALNKNQAPEALSVINKALAEISSEELNTIRQRWVGLKIAKELDYTIFYKIALGVIILVLFFLYWNRKLNYLVQEKTKELNLLLDSFDKNVIFSRTDLKGKITHASEAFCKISGYSVEELVGKPHNIVRHPDMPKETFKKMWAALKNNQTVNVQIKNLRKDGTFYWTDGTFEPMYNKEGEKIGYNALRVDITDKKEVEELSANLEIKVIDRTKKLDKQKVQMERILSAMLLPLLITSKSSRKIVYANSYAQDQYEGSLDELIDLDVNSFYTSEEQREKIFGAMLEKGVLKDFETTFKTLKGNEFDALLSLVDIEFENEDCYLGIASDITRQKQRELELRELHKLTRDSIEYASLIQHTLIPEKKAFDMYFKDHFTLWTPKDIVGGDIYIFEELRGEGECILMVIDCTGHGVPGAFVTMLVKAIERQIVSEIINNEEMEVSPASILSYFNKSMKRLLKQEDENSISNAGFDGGVLYYNKSNASIKYSGAETPLFYTEDGELKFIKGDRHSIGYKKSDMNYEFKEHTLDVKEGMQFYLTTDGYLDQNGGEKGFPFGRKRFMSIIEECKDDSFSKQKEVLVSQLEKYQGDEKQNDDITIVGIKIS